MHSTPDAGDELSLCHAIIDAAPDAIVLMERQEAGDWRCLFVNPAYARLTGIPRDAILGRSPREALPARSAAVAMGRYDRAADTREPVEFETRVESDGVKRILAITLTPLVTDDQVCTRVIGLARDVTERIQIQEERDRYFRLSLDMMATTDVAGRFTRVNPAWERVLGYSPEEMVGHRVLAFVHPDDRPAIAEGARRALEGEALVDLRARLLCKHGGERWLSWNGTPLLEGSAYAVVRDVTKQVEDEQQMRELLAVLEENAYILAEQAAEMDDLRDRAEYVANHDVLTGVKNRRAWFAAAAEGGTAVAVVDIDHFKRINDTWGHPAGDQVLAEVAWQIEAALGESAVVGRIGGEEFGALFTVPFAEARERCEVVREIVGNTGIQVTCGEFINVTVSVGLAHWRPARSGEEALALTYEAADRGLYESKEAGRNRVTVSVAA